MFIISFLNASEDSSKQAKRQRQGPGDDISDIEHLLDDQPLSEFTSRAHSWFVFVVSFGFVSCFFFLTLYLQPQRRSGRSRMQGWQSDFLTHSKLKTAKPHHRNTTSHPRRLQSSMNPLTPSGRMDA